MLDKRITEGNEDPYIILRVRRDARPLEIRKAYASLALKLHPDLFYGQEAKYKSAEEKFKTINWAYDVLDRKSVV
jgi:curved DNA-binding protein CbpA